VHKFVRNLITEWRRLKLPFSGETVIVAVSGGADSVSLLLALVDLKKRKKLDHKFVVAHFNHKLRGKESDGDEQFVRRLAEKSNFEFVSGAGMLKGKSDLEHRARDARYKFLGKVAKQKKSHYVLTAHTMNDQAETFLINLVRGSGVDGLSSIPAMRNLRAGSHDFAVSENYSTTKTHEPTRKRTQIEDEILLIRPMVNWAKRAETESYCRELGIAFRQDSMNDDLRFTRVRIRKTVIPMLAELNPKIVEALCRAAALLAEPTRSKRSETEIDPAGPTLKLNNLKSLEKGELYKHIRTWLAEKRGNLRGLQLKHIEAVARLVNSPKSGRVVELPGGVVIKSGGRLAFRHIKLEN